MLKDFFTALGTGALNKVLHAVLVLVIGILIIRIVTKLLRGGLEKSHLEKAAHSLILSLAKVAMYILLGLSVASSLGIDVTGIVALASVLTLAVSLSLQNMLTNVIGGFTILSTHPFHSGDYVEIAGQSGTVQEINMTYTRLAEVHQHIDHREERRGIDLVLSTHLGDGLVAEPQCDAETAHHLQHGIAVAHQITHPVVARISSILIHKYGYYFLCTKISGQGPCRNT